jgi:hypothetical protein
MHELDEPVPRIWVIPDKPEVRRVRETMMIVVPGFA